MYRKILVPLDGSPLAERALPYAEVVARRSGAQLLLVRAAEAHVMPGGDIAGAQRRVVDEAEAYLTAVAARLDPEQAVETGVFYGSPHEGILEEIRLRGADLVVMSTHGRSGLPRLIMGSVADHVLRHAPVPVMLVPPPCERSWSVWERGACAGSTGESAEEAVVPATHWSGEVSRSARPFRVLVPLDGSAYAAEALPVVRELAKVTPLHVTLVSAIDITPVSLFAAGSFEFDEQVDTVESMAMRRRLALTREVERLDDVSPYATVHVLLGSPARVIVECADAEKIDLVIMATHGRGGLSRMVMGSVASGVLHALRCPLLLVHPTEAAHSSVSEPEASGVLTAA